MPKAYEIGGWGINKEIREVEYVKRTEHTIWFPGGNHSRIHSRYSRYFFDRADAVNHLRQKLQRQIEQAERDLAVAKSALKLLNEK